MKAFIVSPLLALTLLAGCSLSSTKPHNSNTAPPKDMLAEIKPGDGCHSEETALACDRRAILAMAGEYRVHFAFDEVVALRVGYTLKKPQRSGGEEWVEVIENSATHISLQHTLVGPKGEVTKHWRQDWDYQPRLTWRYVGDNTWQRRELTEAEVRGKWVQSVWQVDDSPRYAGVGAWVHDGNSAIWTSDLDWRPLPRREHTTRNDYDVIVAINRHEIGADGWVHLQDNLKLDTSAAISNRYLARETGNNRYEKISGFDFQPARDYWEKTSSFWALVRAGWTERFARADSIKVKESVDGIAIWMAMLEAAEADGPRDAAALKTRVDAVLDRYLEIRLPSSR